MFVAMLRNDAGLGSFPKIPDEHRWLVWQIRTNHVKRSVALITTCPCSSGTGSTALEVRGAVLERSCRGSWSARDARGAFCRRVQRSGRSWSVLEARGALWRRMERSGRSWGILEARGPPDPWMLESSFLLRILLTKASIAVLQSSGGSRAHFYLESC